jgi:AcrR family transcriptional regulator
MPRKEEILNGSVAVIAKTGLVGWTVDQVARETGCAKGLVLYHYRGKTELLDATADRLLKDSIQRRVAAIGAGAAGSALARLWWALLEEVSSGQFAALVSLRAIGLPIASTASPETLRTAAATALDVAPEALAEGVTIAAMLDGLALQLLSRRPEAAVREAYDQLWVSLVEPE